MLASINWNIDPELFSIGFIHVRWYGLLFAAAFLLGYNILKKMFVREKLPEAQLEKLFIYLVVATVIGARLGHVFFYNWDYYSKNLGEIIMIWKGGLASHGAAFGIIIALWWYSKKVSKRNMLWVLDKVVVPIALAGFFIRIGNFMNSEIIGKATDLPWAVSFLRAHIDDPLTPRHPAQLYESFSYLFIFIVLNFIYFKTKAKEKQGTIFGLFLILVFTARFLIEFVKENQEAFENNMLINMGQTLSLPFILAGLFFVGRKVLKAN